MILNSGIDTDPSFVIRVLIAHFCLACVAIACLFGVYFPRVLLQNETINYEPENKYKLRYKKLVIEVGYISKIFYKLNK